MSYRLSEREHRGKHLLEPKTFGRSRLGSPLEVFLPPTGKAKILVCAGQHGDEPETTILLSHAIRSLLPSQLRAAVILAMNPDGLIRGTRGNAEGVDLNRNFPTSNWGEGEIFYRWSSEDPRDVRLSAGTAAASEPETLGLLQLLGEIQPEYIVSIHAPLDCVDDPMGTPLGVWISKQTAQEFVQDIGYPTPGSFGTWAKAHEKKLITWELPHLSNEAMRKRFAPTLLSILSEFLPENILSELE